MAIDEHVIQKLKKETKDSFDWFMSQMPSRTWKDMMSEFGENISNPPTLPPTWSETEKFWFLEAFSRAREMDILDSISIG